MDHLTQLKQQVQNYILALLVITNFSAMTLWWVAVYFLHLNKLIAGAVGIFLALLLSFVFTKLLTAYVMEPITVLWQAILHVAPEHQGTAAPNLEKTKVGRELVTSLALQVYQLASTMEVSHPKPSQAEGELSDTIVNNLPLPLIVLGKDQVIVFANKAAADFVKLPLSSITGQNVYSVFDLAFPNENTLDKWLGECRKDKVTASSSWEHVRLETAENKLRRQFDMVAYYNKNNPDNAETIIGFFDQTAKYAQDDDSLGFIALAVHELRTPLTMLRGYIEALDEELAGKLDPQLADFLQKMQVASQQLASFVTNILNVARVEENQLFLQLKEEKWEDILTSTVSDMRLRAKVQGKELQLKVQTGLPTVAVDRTTISEVMYNLIDNAIKYSDKSKPIVIASILGSDGFVETVVKDSGMGIPANVMGNLFEKFYRNHRSRAQIGGTGLGLYLSKSIVKAHGGQIWVQSKEGVGSTFGFSLVPYAKLASELKKPDNTDITRIAHGWIKNHSFFRR